MLRSHEINIAESDDCEDNNFYCQICNYPIISSEDVLSNKLYKCCNDCYLTFIESRKKEWVKGWRPKQNKIDSYIKIKDKLYQKMRRAP